MTYIHPDKLIEIRKVELLSYLRMYEPENLVRLSSGVYCTREHDSLKISNGNRHFWCRGHYVDTVGKNEKKIAEYIRTQLQGDIVDDQMTLKEYIDPFTGEKMK